MIDGLTHESMKETDYLMEPTNASIVYWLGYRLVIVIDPPKSPLISQLSSLKTAQDSSLTPRAQRHIKQRKTDEQSNTGNNIHGDQLRRCDKNCCHQRADGTAY